MSAKKKNAPLPASSAGLLRFYEADTPGIKLRPEAVVGFTVTIIVIGIVLLFL
jgi:preprotein translocase subunit Sec61beta